MSNDTEDLATVQGVLLYVSGTPFECTDASPLTGGFGNYTYRLKLRLPFNGHTMVILKHGKPYVAGMKAMSFSLDRQCYEVAALQYIIASLPQGSLATVPDVFKFDRDANVIIMSDCGEGTVTLKQLLLEHPPSSAIASKIGHALGEFLGHLHAIGRADDGFRELFAKNEEGKQLSALVTYGLLVSTLTDGRPATLTDPPFEINQRNLETIAAIAQETRGAMLSTRETVVMGDFWPGNVIVSVQEDGGVADVDRIYVIDWEMAKTGLAGLDIGQFVAELYLIRAFKPQNGKVACSVLDAFLRAYRGFAGPHLDAHVVQTAMTHVGAHLVAWTPRAGWGPKDRVRDVVQEGVDLLVGSDRETQGHAKQLVLDALLH